MAVKKVSELPVITGSAITQDDFAILNDGNSVTSRGSLVELSSKLGVGYEVTGGFKGKSNGNDFVWTNQPGDGILITQTEVDARQYKVFEFDYQTHTAVDGPYWTSDPAADTAMSGSGLFGNLYTPMGVTEGTKGLIDFETIFNEGLYSNGDGIGTTGSFDLRDTRPGDQLRVRFDFNATPLVSNTTIEPALWYQNATSDRTPTYRFALTAQPIFFGAGTAGKTFLNRVEISAWIAGVEDQNSISLPAIRSNQPIYIQPSSVLVTVLR